MPRQVGVAAGLGARFSEPYFFGSVFVAAADSLFAPASGVEDDSEPFDDVLAPVRLSDFAWTRGTPDLFESSSVASRH